MNKHKPLLFLALGGHFTATAFTQLMYWKYGYPSQAWHEANPVLHMVFLDGRPWLHLIHAMAVAGLILISYLATKSKILYVRAFAIPWFYALALGYVLDGFNDMLAYFFLVSLPYRFAILAMAAGGLIAGIFFQRNLIKVGNK